MSTIIGVHVPEVALAERLCRDSVDAADEPTQGWTQFLKELTLEFRGTPALLPERSETNTYKHTDEQHIMDGLSVTLDGCAPKGYAIRLKHTPTSQVYVLKKKVSAGTFGVVWMMKLLRGSAGGLPASIAIKLFTRPVSIETAAEVRNIETANTVDVMVTKQAMEGRKRKLRSSSNRVPAVLLQDDNDAYCVVMPYFPVILPWKASMSHAIAFDLLKYVFQEVNDMFKTYELLCFDLKSANMLVECHRSGTGFAAHVRAADYGGYAFPNRVVRGTYPMPWTFHQDGADISNRSSEEYTVYLFLPLFLSFVFPDALTRITSLDGLELANITKPHMALAVFEDVLRAQWPPEIRRFIEYATRYELASADGRVSAGYNMARPKATMQGVNCLFATQTLEVY
jgi:hypothetical protein